MREAVLAERLTNSRVRCNICQWRCIINEGKYGVCRMYHNINGVLYNMNFALASSVAVDPIEKKPLFHFYPGSTCFSVGGWGCNFHCLNCQNWEISCVEVGDLHYGSRQLEPAQAVVTARNKGCAGIAWTYNEPTMWFEYTLESARLAKENNLYTVYVTNGYITPEALDMIGPYLDAWRVDIKGFSDSFYRNIARIVKWRGILEVARRAKDKWRMHVEVVTNIIPTMNDDEEQLRGIACWIRDELGELTPWHVTRFYPQNKLMALNPTPVATLELAYRIGQAAGLKFIYAGNVPGHQSESTECYSCGKVVVRRVGYQTEIIGLNGSKCRFCGSELNFRSAESARRSV